MVTNGEKTEDSRENINSQASPLPVLVTELVMTWSFRDGRKNYKNRQMLERKGANERVLRNAVPV